MPDAFFPQGLTFQGANAVILASLAKAAQGNVDERKTPAAAYELTDYRPMKQSSLYLPKRQTWKSFYSTGAAAILSVFISSCAVVLVGPYDEVTDNAITDLETKGEQFFAKQSTTVSYQDTKSFVHEAQAGINAIRLRAEVYGKDKNRGELRDLDLLSENLNNLMDLAKTNPSQDAWKPARTLVETNFQALIQIELAKKRSSGVSAPKSE